jgi:hypothetical protein
MSTSKFLSDSGWKEIAAKNNVKDNGLLKKLADFKKVGDDQHDEGLKVLDEALKLATQLKRDKKTAPAAGKYLDELTAAAEAATRELGKAKLVADKAAKSKAEAEKKPEEDDEEEVEASELLTTKLKPLLRQVAKGERMHALVAKSGKQVVVMLSRKPIPPARRKMLADELGGGSTKYYPGHCVLEAGATTFVLKAEVAGMSKLIKLALLEQTGLRLNKIKCRGEDGDDDDADGDGDELPDVVAGADEEDDGADKGRRSAPEAAPAVAGPAREQVLAEAPQIWKGTRALLQSSIDTLKQAVQSQVAEEGNDVIDEVNDQLQKLDRIMSRLDKRLTNSLTNASETQDPALRSAALRESKTILAEYIRYVRSEPLIEHLDSNPFGVKMNLKATLAKSLAQVATAIG